MIIHATVVDAARGVSPYIPLKLSPEIERQVERLMILAGQPVLIRPIPAAAVLDALPAACEQDTALCEEVRRNLAGFMETAAISHASTAVAGGSGGRTTALFNRRGMNASSAYEASLAGYWRSSDRWLVNAGVIGHEDDVFPTGSFVMCR